MFDGNGNEININAAEWAGKTIGVIGDSFTALGNWAQEMGENLGATIISKARSGTGFANQNLLSAYKQAQLFVSEFTNPDAFIIAIGTNDNNTEITDITDVSSVSELSDAVLNTFTGGMQATILYLQEHYPNARIFIGWTPANGYWSSGTYSEYLEKMENHVDKMKEVARWYGIEYIETRDCGFSRKNSVYAQCWADDYHPSELGHHKIAQYMTILMKSVGA